MKIIINLLSLILMSSTAIAQSYIIEYERRADLESQLKNITDPQRRKVITDYLSKPVVFYLYYDNGKSLFIQEKEKKTTNESFGAEAERTKTIDIGKNNGGVYKNFLSKEYLQEADVLGKMFLIDDKLEKIDWTLMDEEKPIGTLKCKKAVAKVNNEAVVAWYCDQIAIQDGPYDFYGLPGLIIELYVLEIQSYHAISIHPTTDKLEITKPSKGTKVSKKEYFRILDEKINELKQGKGNSIFN